MMLTILRNALILTAVAAIAAAGTAVYFIYRQPHLVASRTGSSIQADTPLPAPRRDYDLYYYEPETGILAREIRELEAGPALEDQIRVALEALARPPERPDLVSPVGTGFSVRAVYINPEARRAWVDIASGLLPRADAGAQEAWAAIYGCVNTACAASDAIDEVALLDNGAPFLGALAGWDLREAFQPEIAFVEYASAPDARAQ